MRISLDVVIRQRYHRGQDTKALVLLVDILAWSQMDSGDRFLKHKDITMEYRSNTVIFRTGYICCCHGRLDTRSSSLDVM